MNQGARDGNRFSVQGFRVFWSCLLAKGLVTTEVTTEPLRSQQQPFRNLFISSERSSQSISGTYRKGLVPFKIRDCWFFSFFFFWFQLTICMVVRLWEQGTFQCKPPGCVMSFRAVPWPTGHQQVTAFLVTAALTTSDLGIIGGPSPGTGRGCIPQSQLCCLRESLGLSPLGSLPTTLPCYRQRKQPSSPRQPGWDPVSLKEPEPRPRPPMGPDEATCCSNYSGNRNLLKKQFRVLMQKAGYIREMINDWGFGY